MKKFVIYWLKILALDIVFSIILTLLNVQYLSVSIICGILAVLIVNYFDSKFEKDNYE